MIEADGLGVVLEDQRGAELVVGEALHAQDAAVAQVVEHLVLALGGADEHLPLFLRGGGRERVPPDAAAGIGEGNVDAFPILPARAFHQQRLEPVVGDEPIPLGLADAGLVHRPADAAHDGAVDPGRAGRIDAGDVAGGQRGDDAGASLTIGRGGAVARADASAGVLGQFDLQALGGDEQQRFEVRAAVVLERLLMFQQPGELLALAARQQQRVVDRLHAAFVLPRPAGGIAGERAGMALDLDQEEADGREDQDVDFVDAAVVGDEVEALPGEIRVGVGELAAQVIKRLLFPRELGGRDDFPACRTHRHRAIPKNRRAIPVQGGKRPGSRGQNQHIGDNLQEHERFG